MSGSCIFCRIVDDALPSRTVYEDDTTAAFLDKNPLAPAHTLVVPKAHHERLNDMPAALAADVFATLQRVVPAAEFAADAAASTVAFNNGRAAGQVVPHVHGHVVPRFDDDGGGPIHAIAGSRPSLSDDEMDELAEDVRRQLDRA